MTRCTHGGCPRPATVAVAIRAGFRLELRPVCGPCATALGALGYEVRPFDPGGPEWLRRAREGGRGLPARVERGAA